MDCERATNLISARVDGELAEGEASSLELDAHLAGCAACRASLEAMQAQDAALVRAFAGRRRAAEALAEVVVDQLDVQTGTVRDEVDAEAGPQRADRTRRSRRMWLGLAAAAAAAASFALAVVLLRHSPLGERVWALRPRAPAPSDVMARRPGELQEVAHVTLATGNVFTCPQSGTEWRPAPVGSPVEPDTRVRTPASARCELRLPDGTQLCLNADTEARLTGGRRVELERGQVWSAVPTGAAEMCLTVSPGAGEPAGRAAAYTPPGGQSDLACTPGGGAVLTVVRGAGRVADRAGGETIVNAGESMRLVNGAPAAPSTVIDPIGATRWINELLLLRNPDDPELLARVSELLSRIRTEAATRPAAAVAAAAPGPQEQEVRAQGHLWSGPIACYVLSPASRAERDKRLAAARLLADLAPAWTIPDLIAILGDRDGDVRENAAKALQRLTGQQFGDAAYLCATESSTAASQRQRQWQAWWEQNQARYPKPPTGR